MDNKSQDILLFHLQHLIERKANIEEYKKIVPTLKRKDCNTYDKKSNKFALSRKLCVNPSIITLISSTNS